MLRDAVAVVTGAASGIGRALAERFAVEGARRVVVADLDEAGARAVAESLPGGVGLGVSLDVSDEAAVRELVAMVERDAGRIDLWCSNAGVAAGRGLGDDSDWDLSWRVNVLAHLYAARAVLPGMVARGAGHLMATASAAGLLTEVATAPYTVTKHGAVALAEWLAIRYAGTGVSFSCLCPQGVRTPMLAGVEAGSPTLAGGVLEPARVADAVVGALAEGTFLILPHPKVAEYERRRAGDRDRWLTGMARAAAATRDGGVPAAAAATRDGGALGTRPAADPGEVPGLDLRRLSAYLEKERPELLPGGELTARLIPGGRSNLTYELGDDWVLRRPPLGHVLATAHDMAREFRVMTALAGSPVPVPETALLCPDPDVIGAPFYIMRRVPGTVYRTAGQARAGLGDPGAAALADHLVTVLAALHTLDPDDYGLADFGRPDGYLQRQVRRWRAQLDSSRSRPVAGIDDLAERLAARLPRTERHSIVHGDYRLDNCLVAADGRIAAVLDWEMSTLGDPLTDLGLLTVYWTTGSRVEAIGGRKPARNDVPGAGPDPRHRGSSEGLPLVPIDQVIEAYAKRSGRDLSSLPWYVAFGYFKLAVILEGIHYRYVRGKTVGEGFDTVGAAVAPLVAAGLAALDGAGLGAEI